MHKLLLPFYLPQSAEVEYSLDLLHRMLDCHAVQGLVNEASYNEVIEKWVQDVRSHSPSSRGSHCQDEDDLQDVSSYYYIIAIQWDLLLKMYVTLFPF